MEKSIFDNVLYIAPNYRYWKGGISAVLVEYKNSIRDFHYLPSTSSSNIYLTTLSFPFLLIAFIFKLLVDHKIKIVHIHGASKGSFYRKFLYFILTKKIFKKKVVYHIHGAGYHLFYGGASPTIRKAVQYMIQGSDTLIVLSDWWQDYFSTEFKHKNIKIVPNIVADTSKKIEFKSNNSNIDKKPAVVNILFLGRIGDRKGIFDLLKVLADNLSYFQSRCYLRVGGDGEVNKLLAFVKDNHLSEMVEYIGFVQGEEKEKILLNADIYMLPSYNEGLPISVLEAMSYAKPIISTNVGGIPEIVQNNYNGVLIEPGDLEAIKGALVTLLEDKELLIEYGKRSYALVKEKHFPDSVLDVLSDLYLELI